MTGVAGGPKRARRWIIVAGSAVLLCCTISQLGAATEPTNSKESISKGSLSEQDKGHLSLAKVAPELYFTAKRSSKFYGDPNSTGGSFLERSFLFGDAGGVRDTLLDNGIFLDAGLTQFVQGNVSGGNRTSATPRYSGSVDFWAWLDSGKAGLWSGGAVFLHAEGRWNKRINEDVGSTLPANFDPLMPNGDSTDPNWAFSEWYLMQGLPGDLLAAAGKIDMAAWADTNMFANSERSQFAYTGLINNAIAGAFFPYTTLGGWLSWSPSNQHNFTAVYAAADDNATQAGFDDVFNGDDAYAAQYIFSTKIVQRPGRYILAGAYSTREINGFDVATRYGVVGGNALRDIVVGLPGLDQEDENYAVIGNFSQFLWVKDGSAEAYNKGVEANPHSGLTTHRHIPPVGIGVFGRAGWAPEGDDLPCGSATSPPWPLEISHCVPRCHFTQTPQAFHLLAAI